MFRFIVYLVIGYFLWKVIQTFTSTMGRRQGPQQGPQGPTQKGSPSSSPRTFSNVKDAEFEDLTPRKGSTTERAGQGAAGQNAPGPDDPGPSRPGGS